MFFLLHRSLQMSTWEIIGAERFCAKVLGNGFFELLEKRESERGRWEVSVVVEVQKELQFESVSLC